MATTAQDLIKGALRRINSYQSGETIASPDDNDCLETLNDLLDSWSTDEQYVFGSQEYVLTWITGQNKYRLGNPTCTDIGESTFTGTLTGSSTSVTSITNMPSDIVAGTSASGVGAGSTVTDSAGVLPAGTYVVSKGSTTLTLSAAATSTPSANPVTLTYTIPGDFAIPRPLRINGAYTRINNLDFPIDVYTTQDEYNAILYKSQPGPWPTVAWYNNAYPYGLLNVFQTPGSAGELHLFTDTILSNLTLTQTMIMPQGYARALKWCLAREICAEYGYPISPAIKKLAAESLAMIKALNAKPTPRASYDKFLTRGNRTDAGWIIHGGFR